MFGRAIFVGCETVRAFGRVTHEGPVHVAVCSLFLCACGDIFRSLRLDVAGVVRGLSRHKNH